MDAPTPPSVAPVTPTTTQQAADPLTLQPTHTSYTMRWLRLPASQ